MPAPAVRQFAGDVRFWERNGETLTPVIPEASDPNGNQPVELDSLTFSYEAGDAQNVVSKRRDARYQQPIHSATLPGTTSVTAVALEIPPLFLARMLFGEGSTAIVTGAAVVDEAVTVANTAVPVQLAHRMLAASPAPVVEKGGTPLVLNTDYTLDLRRGQVIPKAGGDIDADDALTVSYTHESYVSTSIIGGATPTKQFYVTGDMEDRISGENGELRIPQANLTTDGEVDWLSLEPIQVTLTGPCVVAAGESAPYTFVAYHQS